VCVLQAQVLDGEARTVDAHAVLALVLVRVVQHDALAVFRVAAQGDVVDGQAQLALDRVGTVLEAEHVASLGFDQGCLNDFGIAAGGDDPRAILEGQRARVITAIASITVIATGHHRCSEQCERKKAWQTAEPLGCAQR